MKTLTSDQIAALTAPVLAYVQLLKLDFPSQTLAYNSSNWDLPYDGVTYKGAYGLCGISPVENAHGNLPNLSFELSGASAAMVALALDGSDEWQGCPVTLSLAILKEKTDRSGYDIALVDTLWSGYGDTMTIERDNKSGRIHATAESDVVDFIRGSPLTYSDASQQLLYPGDQFFKYTVDQVNKQVVWPARSFFLR